MTAAIALTDAPIYPGTFPLPDRAPYSIAVDMGIVRSAMAAGNVRQRRLYGNMPQTFSLAFQLHTDELADWQSWVNDNAYDWILLPLASLYAPLGEPLADGSAAGLVSLHLARFTSDLAISLEVPDWFAVSVTAELSPAMFAEAPRPSGLDRIDGLHPADNLPGVIDGGHPYAPSLGGPIDGGELTGTTFSDTRALLLGERIPLLLGGGGHLQTGA